MLRQLSKARPELNPMLAPAIRHSERRDTIGVPTRRVVKLDEPFAQPKPPYRSLMQHTHSNMTCTRTEHAKQYHIVPGSRYIGDLERSGLTITLPQEGHCSVRWVG